MRHRIIHRDRIGRALRLIKERLSDPNLSPSLIAREVNLDLPVFCKAFKRVTGITCTDYIAIERIRMAKQLLTREDMLIKEIAHEVGFGNPNYFSRRFRAMEGRTPSSYRRLNHD
jgi:AraC-like DNA-binding protein